MNSDLRPRSRCEAVPSRWDGLGVFASAALLACVFVALPAEAADPAPQAFLEAYCIDCHAADYQSGEREFESLDWTLSHLDNQIAVQEIIDQLTLGSMPPEDGQPLAMEDRLAAINAMTRRLTAMRQQTASTGGRTVLRRLSRREYRNTVGDLLGLDMTMFDPTLDFPAENLSHHFDNVGASLVTSGHLLERYLDAADVCVEKAFAISEWPEPQQWSFKNDFVPQRELLSAHRAAFNFSKICLYDHPSNEKPEGAYGHLPQLPDGVPVSGTYEVRVLARAMHRDSPYGGKAVRIDLEEPFRLGIRPGDTRIGDLVHNQPIQPLLAETTIGDTYEWHTFEVPLDAGFTPRFTFENGQDDFRGSVGRTYRLHKNDLPEKARSEKGIYLQRIALIRFGQPPHIRIDEVQIRGPIEPEWPTRSLQIVLGGESFDPATAEANLLRFASRAYRRPLTDEESADLVGFYAAQQSRGQEPFEAFKTTLKGVLCSPGFLYHKQPGEDGTLSPHGLAERLAYFLTSAPPDEELRSLADSGAINRPEVLAEQTRRLLASDASDAFVADFLDSWLNLRDLGSMPPDRGDFWFYYAANLEREFKTETRLFLADLINRDAPATNLLTGDYSFLNRDLAKLYGVADAVPPGDAARFRRVEFADRDRGGLLGQGSILTVSANGIETSPVVRGVWLLENILGTPTPPPPDDVPSIEPDTRGAVTIRDQLAKHRQSETCNQCHRKIDPLGFALEGFDAIGRSRNFYDVKRRTRIDTSGVLPGGDAFVGPKDLKTALHSRRSFFVRTLVSRLLTHALGRQMEPTDRAAIDAILAEHADEEFPMASLIESIVLSDLFGR